MRACNNCTACCEGYLAGEVHGHNFYRGKPCHYMGSGCCSIYSRRPKDPCISYKCEWLTNQEIPEWMKPSLSNILMSQRTIDGIEYLEVMETNKSMSASALLWLIQYALSKQINMYFMVEGGWNHMGSDKFIASIKGKNK